MSVTAKRCLGIGLLAALLIPAASRPQAPKNDFILYGGDVVTLDEADHVAEAVWVRDGKIEAVGTREEIERQAPKSAERIDLGGHALLPGFVEPHLHLDGLAQESFFTDLAPCLPDRYETRKDCQLTILEALTHLKVSKIAFGPWRVGSGIDPSRMSLDGNQSASAFRAKPTKYIDQHVSATSPVFILDQSGHLAYTNRQAFVTAGICAKAETCGPKTATKEPTPPGKWEVGTDGLFTGLLIEEQAYEAFVAALAKYKPDQQAIDARAAAGARDIARAGVTTMVNGGTTPYPGSKGTAELLKFFRRLVSQSPAHPMLRYRTLVPWNGVPEGLEPSLWDKDDPLFGVTGIKLWADGSTQGCTAALNEPYDKNGSCGSADTGMLSFTKDQLIANLKPLWKKGWPIQIHVNGDWSIKAVLNALADLQRDTRNDSPIILIHFTVDGNPATGEDMIQQVADLRAGRFVSNGKTAPPVDVRVTHLIGHVAYWGGAFQGMLDGVSGPGQPDEKGRAARLDATRRELELGVPFSLHSDAPVSPTHPLWYVEQAVTRNTWFYPKLTDADAHTMPGGQNITIAEALRAVTIEPARQNGLDRHIGSIEKGKVADLVILDKNPLKQKPNEIHKIQVLSTFVGGSRNDWPKE